MGMVPAILCALGDTNLHFGGVRGWIAPQRETGKAESVMEEPAEVRVGRGQRLIEAVREDLELFGVAELEERIEILQSEIARAEAQIDRKRAGRAAADALFGARSG